MRKILLFFIVSMVFASCDPERVFTESQEPESVQDTTEVVMEQPVERCSAEMVMDASNTGESKNIWKVTYEDREFLVFSFYTRYGVDIEVIEL